MIPCMHELFDHTADLGLRVRAGDLDTLFAESGACLVDDPAAVRPTESQMLSIEGSDREFLLFDWLRELLHRSDEARMLWCRFEVTVSSCSSAAVRRPITRSTSLAGSRGI